MKNNNQWAVVTGASKGIGYYFCDNLLAAGYNIIAVARDTQSVTKLQAKYPDNEIKMYDLDLSKVENAYKLYDKCEDLNVTLVINNAGYGVWGEFARTDLDKELNMIDLNISSLHVLTKLFTKKFLKYNHGRIINIASIAAFMAGPAFASYYASKAYVLRLGMAINTELKVLKSRVRVVTICPGPLKTDFWKRAAEDDNSNHDYSSDIPTMDVATFTNKALDKALKTKNKNYILIGFWNRLLIFLLKITPQALALRLIYQVQKHR